ncbi:MAG TPA: alkaline phosphatase D family protein, partial [Anaerolineales bacterium]|nr:alkaline phosphatase D family protein [Anaerolineales bacterium]
FMIMDDHEVDNDWSWTDPEKTQARIPWFDRLFRWLAGQPFEERSLSPERVAAALQAYWEHQAMHTPLPDERLGGLFLQPAPLRLETQPEAESGSAQESVPEISALPEVESLGSFYYHFAYGAAAFFVFDLRTQRVKGDGTRILLGDEQWAAFEEWLAAVKDAYPLKFLVSSSSIMFDMWIDITRDRWNGFPDERERLFRLLSDQEVEGVYILTGDLHSSHAIRASLKAASGRALPFWEFCASPFEQSHSILARFTYHPVHSDLLLEQVLDFRAAEYCFGVVKIEYADGETPRARFRVYGAEGELLAEAG